jgi:putative transposase
MGAGAEVPTAEICRKHGVSSKQVRRSGGVRPKRLRALEAENGRLNRMLADTMLDNEGKRGKRPGNGI